MNVLGLSLIASRAICFALLATTLTACPPPQSYPLDPTAPVFQLYSATLVNQVGTTVIGTASGTLGKTSLSLSGDILNASSSDTFTAKMTCSKTQDLSIGSADGHTTIYGTLYDISSDELAILNANGCVITVSKADGALTLKGNLKRSTF
jgi:hypothetical protein